MKDISTIDYAILDRPEVLMFLFHPRPEPTVSPFQTAEPETRMAGQKDILIPVQAEIAVGARFHMAEKSGGNLLFFHGNGEIVADYDELGAVYNQMGINLLAVDYRGYGRSGGKPTVTAMMRDCHSHLSFRAEMASKKQLYRPDPPDGTIPRQCIRSRTGSRL